MTRRRRPPAHVARAWDAWNLATIVWESSRESAANGWATELAEHDETYPAPRFRDYLAAEYADMRHAAELAAADERIPA